MSDTVARERGDKTIRARVEVKRGPARGRAVREIGASDEHSDATGNATVPGRVG